MTKAKGISRNNERKRNYVRGRFGSRKGNLGPFKRFEKFLIKIHIMPDIMLAKLLRSSTNGIQSKRWRMKINY